MIFNNEVINQENILKSRQYFIDSIENQIKDISSGTIKVNNKARYLEWLTNTQIDYEEGKYDKSFTVLQRAYYLQTGESVALLP